MSKKKQTVIKVDINCPECQMEIISKVGKIKGVTSMTVDEEKKTLTVVGTIEPVPIFKALKKIKKNPEIVTVGPPKPKCPYCKYFPACKCGGAVYGPPQQATGPPCPYCRCLVCICATRYCNETFDPLRPMCHFCKCFNCICGSAATPYHPLVPTTPHWPRHGELVAVYPPDHPYDDRSCSIM